MAATKTFLAQVLAMLLLAMHLGETRGTLEPAEVRRLAAELRHVPRSCAATWKSGAAARIAEWPRAYATEPLLPLPGRGNVSLPVGLEGA